MAVKEIIPNIYMVGGDGISHPDDCCVYLLDGGGEWALIDAGSGKDDERLGANIAGKIKNNKELKYLIATHGHIDHIGGLNTLLAAFPNAKLVAHQQEIPAIEQGVTSLTAADWYGVSYSGIKIDHLLKQQHEEIVCGPMRINFLHTPGHTRGSISPYLDWMGKRILFGQDIHGPFNKDWGSDINQWHKSMKKLLELNADILCEGHYGIIKPAKRVREFILGFINQYS